MNYILFEKNIFGKGIKVLFVLLILFISVINYSSDISALTAGEDTYPFINIQAVNTFTETTTIKSNSRLLTEDFSGNVFSNEYSIKKLGNLSKTLNIISETVSEVNQRFSSFLIVELTTST